MTASGIYGLPVQRFFCRTGDAASGHLLCKRMHCRVKPRVSTLRRTPAIETGQHKSLSQRACAWVFPLVPAKAGTQTGFPLARE